MRVSANLEGLAADGAGLAAEQATPQPRACVSPAADPVSMSIAAQLSARGASLEALMMHSGLVRADGGAATQHTSFMLRETDAQNATMFTDGVLTAAVPAPLAGSAPPAVELPEIPAVVGPPVMPGEALSKALHEGGPGPNSLREFASHWRSRAAQLEELADGTEWAGVAIDNDWDDDGLQQAGANTRNHGDWLQQMAGNARHLANTADDYADHVQRALDETPTPQEFAETRAAWLTAWSDNLRANGMLSGQVSALAAAYAGKQAQATEAGHTYFAAATTTSGDMPKPPSPPPPIAKPAPDSDPGSGSPTPDNRSKDDAAQLIPRRDGAGTDNPTPGTGAPPNPDGLLGGPIAPAQDPGALPLSAPAPAVDANAAGQAANIAGTIVGAGLGTLSQLAHGLMPSPATGIAGAPLSALSGLSGLPGMGSPSIPETGMPSDPGLGSPESDSGPGAGDPFDSTSPAVGTPDGTSPGGAAPMAPVGNPSPASAVGPVAGTPSGPSAPAGATPGPGVGGMGMYPPIMPQQGGQGTERNKDLYPDKRVVLRPVPNTEPVFGELEKQRRPRKRAAQEEGDSGAGKD